MHASSYSHMERLVQKYLDPEADLTIVDVGSFNFNGAYRQIFAQPRWSYVGIDVQPGDNVTLVLAEPYKFPFGDNAVDVVISGQAFEHIEYFWLTWTEMARILKPGGKIFVVVPSKGRMHNYPTDCWRFFPDGLKALGKYAKLNELEVSTDFSQPDSYWGDTVGAFAKPKDS